MDLTGTDDDQYIKNKFSRIMKVGEEGGSVTEIEIMNYLEKNVLKSQG